MGVFGHKISVAGRMCDFKGVFDIRGENRKGGSQYRPTTSGSGLFQDSMLLTLAIKNLAQAC